MTLFPERRAISHVYCTPPFLCFQQFKERPDGDPTAKAKQAESYFASGVSVSDAPSESATAVVTVESGRATGVAMLWNIIDKRTRPYRWREVNAIVEAIEHDNSCADADQAPQSHPLQTVDYDQREAVSVREAVAWANAQSCPVTLYLYDLGDGFYGEKHFNEVGNRFPNGGSGTEA